MKIIRNIIINSIIKNIYILRNVKIFKPIRIIKNISFFHLHKLSQIYVLIIQNYVQNSRFPRS